ncbi:Uncharacterised protein [uncultured archaeon]|nr:Uncharacterised protein [uncultured archaeon]
MQDLIQETLSFAVPVLLTIFLGLFFAGFLLELGVLNRICILSRPLVALAHLPDVCASSFVVSLGSTVAANSMIARFREDEIMQPKEVFLCTMVNSIPAYIREIFTYQIPIVVPALGLVAGSLYASVFMVTALVKISLIIILGRFMFSERPRWQKSCGSTKKLSIASIPQAASRAMRGQARIFARIATAYLIMTFLIFALKDRGFFEAMSVLPLAGIFGIPGESIVPLTTYVASPVLGITMLGPMIKSGSLTVVQAMIVLMLGSMFMLPIFALRSLAPNYAALFGPRLGLSVVALSTGISILVRLAFLLAFLRMA